MSLMKLVAGCV